MRLPIAALALGLSALAAAPAVADFPDYLVIRERLGGWPRDNGGGRLERHALLTRIVDASGATLFEELHCDVPVVGTDAEVELALGTVDPARNPLDLRFDGRWSVRVLACDEAACVDGIPDDPLLCDGAMLLDKPLQVVAYAWRSKHASDADRALFADDCDRLDGLDSTDFMPAGTDLWVNETGDAMTGPLVLPADPTEDLQAATKKYVDEQIRSAIPRGYAILGPSLVSPPGFAPSGAFIATDGDWRTLPPLPSPAAATAAVLDGKIYARAETGRIDVYDPAANSWSAIAGPGSGQVLVERDGGLHLLGIFGHDGEHWERAAGSLTWRRRAAVPDDEVQSYAVSAGNLYALAQHAGGAMTLWSWDPGTDTWQRATGAPSTHRRTLVGYQGKLWAIGGVDTGPSRQTTRVDIYDPATGWWTVGPPLKRLRWGATGAVLDGRLYVIGGGAWGAGGWGGWGWGYGYGEEADSMEVFDPAVGAFGVLPTRVPTTRAIRAAVALAGKIHVIGGGHEYLHPDDDITDAHEVFTPQQHWYVHVRQ